MDNASRAVEAIERLAAGKADVEGIFVHVVENIEGHRELNGRTHEWTAAAALEIYCGEAGSAVPARFGAITEGEREALLARLKAWIERHRDRI